MQKTKSIIIFLVVAGLLILGITLLSNNNSSTGDMGDVSTTPTTTPVTKPTGSGASYTLAEVATHKDGTSCWTTIQGKVYDLTAWINMHPGGPEAILSLCGKDGTAAFLAQHGGQAQPAAELKTLLIGTLKK
jgi:cytochrome b involved in lipid metabolism